MGYLVKKIILKIKTVIFKLCEYQLFKGVILYDVPTLIHHENIYFGSNTRINSSVLINAQEKVIIGNNVTLSHGATLLTTGYDVENWKENKLNKEHVSKEINISNHVWIGANVTVLSGVSIAEGVVVAAGSVVTKDLDSADTLYAGVPAKKIKEL